MALHLPMAMTVNYKEEDNLKDYEAYDQVIK